MIKKSPDNYDFLIYYFRNELKEICTIPCDGLKDFILYNTNGFIFRNYYPKNDKHFAHILFTDYDFKRRYALYFSPYEMTKELVFFPIDNKELTSIVNSSNRVFHFNIKANSCSREILDENGFLKEVYWFLNDTIYATFYSRDDTIRAYNSDIAFKPEVSDSTYEFVFRNAGISPTYNIEAKINQNNEIEISVTNASEGNIFYSEKISMEPGMSLYDTYNDYISKIVYNKHKHLKFKL